jgi:nucleoside-diphosphate-sugar epimerase
MFTENHRFQTTVLRFGGLFGYDRKPGNFFPKGRIIDNPGGFVNMIHRDDCIRIIERIIAKNIWNETFNGCADTHPTRREFYTKAALNLGYEVPTFNETGSGEYKIISNQKLKTMLEYEFKYPDLLNIKEGPVFQ